MEIQMTLNTGDTSELHSDNLSNFYESEPAVFYYLLTTALGVNYVEFMLFVNVCGLVASFVYLFWSWCVCMMIPLPCNTNISWCQNLLS